MELIHGLDDWFASGLSDLSCRPDTRAYITGVLARFRSDQVMVRGESVVLEFHLAKQRGDFVSFQRIGDWVLWVGSIHPSYIDENRNVVETIGRLSYHTCHRMMNKKWVLFEELADDLSRITHDVRASLKHKFSVFQT